METNMDTHLHHVFAAIILAAFALTLNIIFTINGFYDDFNVRFNLLVLLPILENRPFHFDSL